MKKTTLIIVATTAIICIAALIFSGYIRQKEGILSKEDLVLSNYPKLFEKDVVIVIGENASQQTLGKFDQNVSQIEKESAIKETPLSWTFKEDLPKGVKYKLIFWNLVFPSIILSILGTVIGISAKKGKKVLSLLCGIFFLILLLEWVSYLLSGPPYIPVP